MAEQIDDFMCDDDFQDHLIGDWEKVDANLKNEGYRAGMEEGFEQCLQKGFNAAFNEALKMSFAAGNIQGNLSAQISIPPKLSTSPVVSSQAVDTNSIPAITNLLSSCSDLINKIPNMLKSDVTLEKKDSLVDGSPVLGSCMSKSIVDSTKGNEEAASHNAKNAASCHEICNNSEHFWSQLESFKLQAARIADTNY
ncbi:Yae1 domain-containing protein 1 [Biomphalaria glabrata]|nr:hypothetical protein BgiMline_000560 [Biomphalaria glabrata]